MKQLLTLLMLAGVFTFSSVNAYAQEDADVASDTTSMAEDTTASYNEEPAAAIRNY